MNEKNRRVWDIDINFPKEKADKYVKELIKKYKHRPTDNTYIQPLSTRHPQDKIK
jgi:hypothetical protein